MRFEFRWRRPLKIEGCQVSLIREFARGPLKPPSPTQGTEETDTVRRMLGAGRQIGELHERVRDLEEIF